MKYAAGSTDSAKSVTQQAERLIAESAEIRMTAEERRGLLDMEQRLKIHLEFVDLLGLCAKERNYIAERFCRENIPVSRAVGVLLKTELGVEIILPYIRYIHGTLFTTEDLNKKKRKGLNKQTGLEEIIA